MSFAFCWSVSSFSYFYYTCMLQCVDSCHYHFFYICSLCLMLFLFLLFYLFKIYRCTVYLFYFCLSFDVSKHVFRVYRSSVVLVHLMHIIIFFYYVRYHFWFLLCLCCWCYFLLLVLVLLNRCTSIWLLWIKRNSLSSCLACSYLSKSRMTVLSMSSLFIFFSIVVFVRTVCCWCMLLFIVIIILVANTHCFVILNFLLLISLLVSCLIIMSVIYNWNTLV
jgi:hypothetical protein